MENLNFEQFIEANRTELIKEGEKRETALYNEYLEDLGLTEEDLKDKKIVDIGAGTRMFAGHCLRCEINSEVYSVEPNVGEVYPDEEGYVKAAWSPEIKKQVDLKTVKAIREKLPFESNSFDLALVHCALPGTKEHGDKKYNEMRESIEMGFNEIGRILKRGGEARIYPFYGQEYNEWRKPWKEAIDAKLEEMRKLNKYQIKIEKITRESLSKVLGAKPEEIARIIIKSK